ncbi:MAG: PEP-CTERM sorting domain-containing protein [Aquabacterium sp.]|uniref:PEP-CTERM sorting domain-containing protein n=1 Tax=Aquabacterium sp. TaxID=1872578 RepID=UPI0025BA5654|nr:PEP-CTERM sorting domain-containing protein [Aquabacterium sp.]MBI5925349.1 PEP-CTERM sorting domain-containing protein [Aquabacterium sp.]
MNGLYRLLWAGALSGAACLSHAELRYTFDADAQGFSINGDAAGMLAHESAGYLRIQDLTDATNVMLSLPESAVAGGWLPYLGGAFSFDARLALPISSYWPEFGAVSLISSQGSVVLDLVPSGEPGSDWRTYSLKLDASEWGVEPGMFASIVANLQRVDINMEAGNGPIETVHLDNVVVSAVPESSTWALFVVGAALMGGASAFRRSRSTAGRLPCASPGHLAG